MGGRGARFIAMRRNGRRDKVHLIEPEPVDHLLGKSQVREMDWIKSASEEANGRDWFQ